METRAQKQPFPLKWKLFCGTIYAAALISYTDKYWGDWIDDRIEEATTASHTIGPAFKACISDGRIIELHQAFAIKIDIPLWDRLTFQENPRTIEHKFKTELQAPLTAEWNRMVGQIDDMLVETAELDRTGQNIYFGDVRTVLSETFWDRTQKIAEPFLKQHNARIIQESPRLLFNRFEKEHPCSIA